MKLYLPQIDHLIEFKENSFPCIIIERPELLRKLICDISSQISGEKGDCVLSFNNTPVRFSDYAEIIKDFTPFNINTKSMQAIILSNLDSSASDESNYLKTQSLISEIEKFIDELSFDFPCGITYDKLNFSSILKSAGICIQNDYDSLGEMLFDYMQIISSYKKNKIFITVNLRSFISDEEAANFAGTVINHKINLLMLEAYSKNKLTGEQRITVDADYCIF